MKRGRCVKSSFSEKEKPPSNYTKAINHFKKNPLTKKSLTEFNKSQPNEQKVKAIELIRGLDIYYPSWRTSKIHQQNTDLKTFGYIKNPESDVKRYRFTLGKTLGKIPPNSIWYFLVNPECRGRRIKPKCTPCEENIIQTTQLNQPQPIVNQSIIPQPIISNNTLQSPPNNNRSLEIQKKFHFQKYTQQQNDFHNEIQNTLFKIVNQLKNNERVNQAIFEDLKNTLLKRKREPCATHAKRITDLLEMVSKQKEKINQQKEEIKKYQKDGNDNINTKQKIDELQKNLDTAKSENQKLIDKNNKLNTDNTQYMDDVEDEIKRVQDCEESKKILQQKISEIESKDQQYKLELENKQQQININNIKITELENQISAANQQYENLKSSGTQYFSNIESSNINTMVEVKRQMDILTNDKNETQRLLQLSKLEIEEMRNQLIATNERNVQLTTEGRQLLEQHEKLRKEYDDLSEKLNLANQTITELKILIAQQKSELSQEISRLNLERNNLIATINLSNENGEKAKNAFLEEQKLNAKNLSNIELLKSENQKKIDRSQYEELLKRYQSLENSFKTNLDSSNLISSQYVNLFLQLCIDIGVYNGVTTINAENIMQLFQSARDRIQEMKQKMKKCDDEIEKLLFQIHKLMINLFELKGRILKDNSGKPNELNNSYILTIRELAIAHYENITTLDDKEWANMITLFEQSAPYKPDHNETKKQTNFFLSAHDSDFYVSNYDYQTAEENQHLYTLVERISEEWAVWFDDIAPQEDYIDFMNNFSLNLIKSISQKYGKSLRDSVFLFPKFIEKYILLTKHYFSKNQIQFFVDKLEENFKKDYRFIIITLICGGFNFPRHTKTPIYDEKLARALVENFKELFFPNYHSETYNGSFKEKPLDIQVLNDLLRDDDLVILWRDFIRKMIDWGNSDNPQVDYLSTEIFNNMLGFISTIITEYNYCCGLFYFFYRLQFYASQYLASNSLRLLQSKMTYDKYISSNTTLDHVGQTIEVLRNDVTDKKWFETYILDSETLSSFKSNKPNSKLNRLMETD